MGAIGALAHPWVVVVHHAVLLAPPVQWCDEEDEAKHPPDHGNLHSEELLKVCSGDACTLWAPLLEPVPKHQLHHLTVLWPVDATATENPILGHRCAVGIGYRAESLADPRRHGLPAALILLVTCSPQVLEAGR
eukprot:CAMPEP_0197619260 /NCGR_PEP_ID=MMETSP1338-20131121/323_1 /TAXON_ID=43686 ORGANISM="Pelagodinium beii, Strain RCC1491" /NCGR_SAMPLE_ID=MMETSP1338 /ASSEMBLY_ACC=CAM_ASM_000754 /LENGTH=133 /DNA_ID=CAMNT_0043188193 /DNA_START=105 /DNA_END=506 /DNA_ORIENTATION=-